MRYFSPFWGETIEKRYPHEIGKLSDGLLVSMSFLENKGRAFLENVGKKTRYDGDILVDCGAFSYINDFSPPYEVEDIISKYTLTRAKYCVSVDHICLPSRADTLFEVGNVKENKRRWKITLDNAIKFRDLCYKNNVAFIPVGVCQGYSVESYLIAFKELMTMYDYIAIGGLVGKGKSYIIDIIKHIEAKKEEKQDLSIHLFGVCDLSILEKIENPDSTWSCDSAKPYLQGVFGRELVPMRGCQCPFCQGGIKRPGCHNVYSFWRSIHKIN